jgi:low temperature requirement protein LtrA
MGQIGGNDSGAAAAERPGLLRRAGQSQQASFVELLFDVVFVFAFTRFSQRLAEALTWYGLYSTTVLLLAMWWVWYRMAWTTNRYNPEKAVIQLMVIITMLGTLLMASALPAAFGAQGVVFAPIYVALQVARHAWLLLVRGNRDAQLVSLRILFWASLSAVPWLAGLAAQGNLRLALWALAVATDYAGGLFDFPTPRLGRAGLRGQRVSAQHLVDRYRQVLIIALGETILISGLQFSGPGFTWDATAALVISFTITVLLWQIYFYRAGAMLPAAIAASKAPAQAGELASYSHLLMAFGVALDAVGDKLIIAQPLGYTKLAWSLVIVGGGILFLAGRGLLDHLAFSKLSWSRPVGIAALGATVPATRNLPPISVGAITAAVLAGIVASNTVAWRLFPRSPFPPTGPATDKGAAEGDH